MLRHLSLEEETSLKNTHKIVDNCEDRIKPTMLSGVKTEAILVFARTALERYFDHIKENDYTPVIGNEEDTKYVYDTLRQLNTSLKKHVVNADYLINIIQSAKVYHSLKKLAKYEEPLMNYYDAMAHKVGTHFANKPAYIPEFLVICVLSHWIVEEEKSIDLYPFLKEIDFEELIYKFESNRADFRKNDECVVSDILGISSSIVEKLKDTKYKVNKERVSKTRKKKR